MTNKGRFQSALMISAYLLLSSVSQAQQNQERVIKSVNLPNEELAIFNLQVAGKPVSFDEKFAAGDDWVKSVSFSIRYDDVASKTERSGLVYDRVIDAPDLRRPGQWQDIAFSLAGKSEPSKRITLSVDFVEFEDGATWGADTFKSSDRITGRRAGAEAERTRLIKMLAQSGIDAVVKAAESGVANPPQGHSSEWEQVFREGARTVAARVRHEFTARGAAAVEPLLKQSVTKLLYEF